MKQKRISRFRYVGLILLLAAAMLVGCRSNQATPAAGKSLGDTYISQALDASYPDALNAASQLILGTMRLEGTEHAITPEQATTLLLLWQALQGTALQSDAERNAVLAKIEEQMTPAQLEAIAAMRLTHNDLLVQAQGNAPGAGAGPGQQRGVSGTPPAPGGAPPGGREMSPEMATRQAQFGNMSEQQRAALRATAQAGGMPRGAGGGASAGPGQDTVWLNALIRLLTRRAAEGAPRTPAPRSLPSPTP